MIKKIWLYSKNSIFISLIFITFSFSLLRGQQLSPKTIQIDTQLVQPDSGLSIDKDDSLHSISDEKIKKEMQFSTTDKVGSYIGGGIFGFYIGAMIGVSVNAAITRPREYEVLSVLPGFFIGGGLGAIVGGKAMYEIVEHSEKRAAKNRLLQKQKMHKQTNDKKSN